jgi:predicted nucleotidyltransferase
VPTRYSATSVLVWPTAERVLAAGKAWALALAAADQRVVRVGVFGSFARHESAFGSDLDLVVVVDGTRPDPRDPRFATESLPVPCDLLIYDLAAWRDLMAGDTRMAETLRREAIWWVGES